MLEAEKLAQKDNFLGLGCKSDPYAKVGIGLQHFRSRTIYKNLNPTWNEVFEVRGSRACSRASRLHSGAHWAQSRETWVPQGLTGQGSEPWGQAGRSMHILLPCHQASVAGCFATPIPHLHPAIEPLPSFPMSHLCWKFSDQRKSPSGSSVLHCQPQTLGSEVPEFSHGPSYLKGGTQKTPRFCVPGHHLGAVFHTLLPLCHLCVLLYGLRQ